jgi:hypothetical protein
MFPGTVARYFKYWTDNSALLRALQTPEIGTSEHRYLGSSMAGMTGARSVYMYVCMYVCMYTYVHMYIYVFMHVCI